MTTAPFLRLNGYTVFVRKGQFQLSQVEVEPRKVSQLNMPIVERRVIRDEWRGATKLEPSATANTLEGLINGWGHHFSFDADLWSSRGLPPESGPTASLVGSGGRFGGYASITSVTWDLTSEKQSPPLTGLYLIGVWRLESSVWVHYWIRQDGAKWVDGVRNDLAATSWLTVSQGQVTITGAPTGFDDLVILPYQVDDDFPVQVYRWFIADNMVAYWTMDSDGTDLLGNHDGTTSGTVDAKGQVDGGQEFSGGADENSVPDAADLSPDITDAFTIDFWLKLDTASQVDRNLIEKFDTGAPNEGYGIYLNSSGLVRAELTTTTPTTVGVTGEAPTVDAWTHIVMTHDGAGTVTLYQDAVSQGTSTASLAGTMDNAFALLHGGSRNGRTAPNGILDDIKFNRRALSLSEVQARYRFGLRHRRAPIPQAFSDLPSLQMTGASIDHRELVVQGESRTENIRNPAGGVHRTVSFRLKEKG